MLSNRKKGSFSNYVFADTGESGYIIEPRKQKAKVIKETEIQFTVHDLRRTFITIAESLDIPAYALKRFATDAIEAINNYSFACHTGKEKF